MPAFYAHYRFGREMLQKLPPKTRALCEQHRDLFDIGLHGPDIFFFYHPLKKNPVSEFGHQCHGRSGREFLSAAETVISAADDKDAARAYFYGFLCHLALDSVCHPVYTKHRSIPAHPISGSKRRWTVRFCFQTALNRSPMTPADISTLQRKTPGSSPHFFHRTLPPSLKKVCAPWCCSGGFYTAENRRSESRSSSCCASRGTTILSPPC